VYNYALVSVIMPAFNAERPSRSGGERAPADVPGS
jgi:hypothetical protein